MPEPDFTNDIIWTHFCRGKKLKLMPMLLCSNCSKFDGKSFDRSLPRNVAEEIVRHQTFLTKLGFELEDIYGRAEEKNSNN
jgi:hypothetical protein